MAEERDIVIIGGGPAGYVAAIRASQLGGKVTLIENGALGGTCLNRGCIPSKSLLHSVELLHAIKNAGQHGINTSAISVDFAKMQSRKNRIIATHVAGVKGLLKGNNIEVIKGRAKLAPAMMVAITTEQGLEQSLHAEKIILATGSKPMVLPIPGADSPSGIINAESILNLESIPESLLMIGGGVIGVEMGTILAGLGCKVTIVEMMPHILPIEDAEVTAILAHALKDDGVQIYEGAKVSRIDDSGSGKLVTVAQGASEQKLEAEVVAIGVGYKPDTNDLGLEEAGVACNKGAIQVNEHMETSVPNIYAAGDAIGGLMLAYVAMAEGVVAAENAAGKNSTIDYQAVPRCTFTLPELASVGLTEEEAVAQGHDIQIGRFPFAANSMATILGERRGMVKIISAKKYGQIIGVHIIGPQATELITEVTLAMKLDATPQELITTLHGHPSLSEAIREAALDITGAAIHAMPRSK